MIPEPLQAGDITLRPWAPEEADIYASLRDDLVFRFTTETPSSSEACRQRIEEMRADPLRAGFAICSPQALPMGDISVVKRGERVEISYWLSAPARGRGWAAAALRVVTGWAKARWQVDEAELEIDPENEASQRAAGAAGYLRHGTRLLSACGGPAVIYRHTSGAATRNQQA